MPALQNPAERFTARKAVPEDAARMVHLQRIAVEKAWQSIIKENFAQFMAEKFNPETQTRKYTERIQDPSRILVIVEDKEEIVGFGGIRRQEPDEHPVGYEYQANAFYLDPAYEGTGASRILLSGLLTELQKRNAQNISAWCLAGNRLARNFYERHGGILIPDAITPKEYDIAPHVAYGWAVPSL